MPTISSDTHSSCTMAFRVSPSLWYEAAFSLTEPTASYFSFSSPGPYSDKLDKKQLLEKEGIY